MAIVHAQGLGRDSAGRNVVLLAALDVETEVRRRMIASVRKLLRVGVLSSQARS